MTPKAVVRTTNNNGRRRNNNPPARIGRTNSPAGAQSGPTIGRNTAMAMTMVDNHANAARGAIQRLDRTSAQLCRVEPADTAMGGSVTGPGPTDTGLSFGAAVVQAQLWLGVFMPRRHEPGSSPSTGALRGLVGAGPSQVGVVGALR